MKLDKTHPFFKETSSDIPFERNTSSWIIIIIFPSKQIFIQNLLLQTE